MSKNQLIFEKKITMINDFPENEIRIVIDGESVCTKNAFLRTMEKNFLFPDSCHGSLDAFMDYITDLSWFKYKTIIVVIKNQRYFLCEDKQLKKKLFECLYDDILPYWENDVLEYCVGGECRKIVVYMVDEVV